MQQQINSNNIKNLLEEILTYAKQAGASAAEVAVQVDNGFSVTARMGEAETLEYHRDNDISITVYKGKKSGNVGSSDSRAESLKHAVDVALRIAQYAEEDPASGLAEVEQLAKNIPQLDIYFPWQLTAQAAMELAQQADQVGLDFDPRVVNSDGTSVSNHEMLISYGNSNGFNQHYQATRHSINSVLVAKDKNEMQRDYYYYTARDAKDLPPVDEIARLAAQRAVSRLNPRAVPTKMVPVMFTPETARSLINHFISAIQGGALYKKSSFLVDKLGESVFPAWFNLQEQPHLGRGLGSTPFDNNGLLTYDKFFLENGILKNYALGVYSARKLNMQSTANAGGTHNLLVTPGKRDFNAMLRELDYGLLITEVMGPGVNIVTGDYSRGVAGFWVEQSRIQYAVDEATIAGNLGTMFKNIRCVGNDVDHRGKILTPSIIIDQMMIAGSSS